MGFPGGSDGKESVCNAGDLGSIPGSGRSPGKGNAYPSSILDWRFHGQKSLASYSPWGHKDLFMPLPISVCMRAQSLHSCLNLCDAMDCSPPSSAVPGILQATILEWIAMSSSRGSSQSRDRSHLSCISCTGGRFFYY